MEKLVVTNVTNTRPLFVQLSTRWHFDCILRGKADTKVTVVTAYNATPSLGESTYYHQQLRVLSRLHREQNILVPPEPRRQFILDLQSWLETLV